MNSPLTILLDLDGVLITTPAWKQDLLHPDGYSDFNPQCVENLNKILGLADCEIWLSSSRRTGKTLEEFNQIFDNRGISAKITGYVPLLERQSRRQELEAFILGNQIRHFLIIDDDKSLNDLPSEWKAKLVLTEYLKGFDAEAYQKAKTMFTFNDTLYKPPL